MRPLAGRPGVGEVSDFDVYGQAFEGLEAVGVYLVGPMLLLGAGLVA